MDTGHWLFESKIPEDGYGFIYLITNTANNRKYIGKKQFFKTIKRPPLKGKKNKRHVKSDSDWRIYTGSSDNLNEDIKKYGKSSFKFEILKICYSKWELAYEETYLQFKKGVLLSDEYYNGIINCRIGKKPNNGIGKNT